MASACRLASAADAVGKTIALNGLSYTVVGVMPDDFDYPLATDVWAPLAFTNEEKHQRAVHSLLALGRLRPDSSVPQAQAELQTVARRLEERYPRTNESRTALVTPLLELTNQVADRFVLILFGSAIFVLLLASANVANLQLARSAAQQREFAVRVALGASRFHVAQQLLSQTVLIAFVGGTLGLVLGAWHIAWIRNSFPATVLRWMAGLRDMHVDPWVLAFTVAASLIAGVLCGVPALWQSLGRAALVDVNEILKEGGRSSSAGQSRGRLQSALVIAEVALALVLLVGAALMVRTFDGMLAVNAGFNPKSLLTGQVSLSRLQYREDAQIRAFYGTVLLRLATLPQVRWAGAASSLESSEGLYVEGRPDPRPGEPWPAVKGASADFFQAIGIPILRGRPIAEQDGAETQRVAVVSDTIAQHYWPNSDPIGSRFRLRATAPWLTVVGVSGDVRDWFDKHKMPRVYVPYAQFISPSMTLYIRTRADPMLASSGLKAKVHEVDKNQPIYDVKSMEELLNEQTSGVRASANMMSMFALIALVLAATGVYAVISHSVVQRTHEVGLRIALGASSGDVLKLTLRRAFYLAAAGLGIGLPAAFGLMRLMSSVLFNVVALDWTVFVLYTLVLASSAALAGYIPARRATKVDPLDALRHE